MSDDTHPRERWTMNRREFMHLAGASLALAGLDGCARMPAMHILPFVDSRPEIMPGIAAHYATAMSIDGFATGLIVESHAGRPTKIEGNPDHPASLGATGPLEQASVLQLYDPDRARNARVGAQSTTWDAIAARLAPSSLRQHVGARGGGLHILIEPTSSPLNEELLARILAAHPDARLYMYAPLAGARPANATVAHYDMAHSDVIVALDSDFLSCGPFHVRYARHFAANRRLTSPADAMNRLYVIESAFTPTGAAADNRFAVRPRELPVVLRALQAMLAGQTNAASAAPPWLAAVARDLQAHAGRSVVIVGDQQPPELRAIGDAINDAIGATGRTAWHAPSPLIGAGIPIHNLSDLMTALRARAVDTLVVVGGNPSYATPAALEFSNLLRAVPDSGYIGLYENETARDVRWFVPMSHYLESWGDTRAYDGTLSVVQPLVNPLYDSATPAEVFAALGGMGTASAYDLLRSSWDRRTPGDAETAWADALQRGLVPGTQFARATRPAAAPAAPTREPERQRDAIDVLFLADSRIHDGAFSNNGWLQELPAPITQLTWGNAALLSPGTARRLGVRDGSHVALSAGARRIELPALAVPGFADDTVAIEFGYGRTGAESLARGVGANAFELWPAAGTRFAANIAVTAVPGLTELALVQTEPAMALNEPVRRATLAEYRAAPSSAGLRPRRELSLYPEIPAAERAPLQWAMTIDLATCIGCGSCVVACQAENNVPVVGASQARNARVMHWLRIDRYFAEREAEVEALLQPMLCQHCEMAPCEYVCPVQATVHSADGLNEMVYNRCVGTRFCSNNCPYKVRRFNWIDYNRDLAETQVMVMNPDVTVRERGVMEKCTFCVQRIREAGIAAVRDGRQPRGTDVRTACQQACPTNAIVFGSLNEPDSEMVRQREQPRSYPVLSNLGTEPRVHYLARIRNPNPELTGVKA